MSQPERFEALVLGSGEGGKLLAWELARAGRRTAVVERRWIGGSCPNIACLPTKNEIWSAMVAHRVRHGAKFGAMTGPVVIDMPTVRRIVRQAAADDYRFKSIVLGVISSDAFRKREAEAGDRAPGKTASNRTGGL